MDETRDNQIELERLRNSEEHLRRLSENLADGMVYQIDTGIAGEIRQFTYISTSVERFHGVTVGEALENAIVVYNSLIPEDLAILATIEEEAVAKDSTFQAEARVARPNGEIRWSLFISEPTRDQRGHLIFDGIELDIHERKIAELRLAQNEETFRRLVEGMGEKYCLFSHTVEGIFLYVSRSFKSLFDFSAEDIIGKDWRELNLSEESLLAGNECDLRVINDRVHQSVELTCYHSDGTEHLIEVNYGPVVENGEVVRMEGICIDVTEFRANEKELLKEQARLAEAQAVAHLGNWKLDLQTDALYWSDEIYRIFEIDKTKFEATYEAFVDAIHPDDRKRVHQAFLDSLKNKTQYDISHRLLMKDGRVKYVHERCRTHFDDKGNALVSFGTVQDITDLKMAEVENSKLQHELYQSQKMDAVGKLAGGIAHDFNNMLGVILGQTEELLSHMEKTSDDFESVKEIKKAAERSARLTRQLLTFSRQEAISPKHIDLNSAIEGMLKMLRRLIGENITISWEPSSESTSVFMDPGQIDQILANLCVNARDAIGASGAITIKTAQVSLSDVSLQRPPTLKDGEYIRLAIRDTGSGISDSVREKIFEPFFTTKSIGQGTGLGLSTVYGIMQQNGGVITVEESSEKGTTMALYLPKMVHVPTERHEPEEQPLSLKGSATILLVEDEEMLLRTLENVLTRHGYEVVGFTTPLDALSFIESDKKQIDVLITDVVMPECNGRQLADTILKRQENINILYMSGYTSSIITDHGVLEKGVTFLQKPFKFNELLLKVHDLIS